MRFLKYLLMFAFVAIAIYGITALADQDITVDATAADVVWDGGGADNLASTDANWVGDVEPTTYDNPKWDTTSSKNCTWDLNGDFGLFEVKPTYSGILTIIPVSMSASGGFHLDGATINIQGAYYSDIEIDGANVIIGSYFEVYGVRDIYLVSGTLNVDNNWSTNSFIISGGSVIGNYYSNVTGNLEITGGNVQYLKAFLTGTGNLKTGTQTVESLTISGSGTITQTGDIRIGAGGYSQTGSSVLVGSTSYWIYCAGNIDQSSSSGWSSATVRCQLMANGLTLDFYGNQLFALKTNGYDATFTYSATLVNMIFDTGSDLVISNGCVLAVNYAASTTQFYNNGTISGEGTGSFYFGVKGQDPTVNFGVITCPAEITCRSDSSTNRIVTLGSNAGFTNTVAIYSAHGTYTLTLTLNGKTFAASSMDVAVRGILTGAGTIDGDLLLTAGTITQTGDLTITGDFTQSGGVLSGTGANYITIEGDTIKSGGSFSGGDVWIKTPGTANISMTGIVRYWNTGTVTVTGSMIIGHTLLNEGTLTIGSGKELQCFVYSNSVYNNTGEINGPGLWVLWPYNGATYQNVGDCANLQIEAYSSTPINCKITLSGNSDMGNLLLYSSSGTYTQTLDSGGYLLSCSKVTVGIRGILAGNDSLITCSGLFDAANGTFTPETSTLELTGTGNLRLGSNSVNNLIVDGSTTIYQDTNARQLSLDGNLDQGAYRVNVTGHASGYGLWLNGTWDGDIYLNGTPSTTWTVPLTVDNWGEGWVYTDDPVRFRFSSMVYLDITHSNVLAVQMRTWEGTDNFTFNASATSGQVVFSVSRGTANALYDLYQDGIYQSSEYANGGGMIAFNYEGPWSSHEFVISQSSYIPAAVDYAPTWLGLAIAFFVLAVLVVLSFWRREFATLAGFGFMGASLFLFVDYGEIYLFLGVGVGMMLLYMGLEEYVK